jgi:hypothetical protein
MKHHTQVSYFSNNPPNMNNNDRVNNTQQSQTQITTPILNTHHNQNIYINTQTIPGTRFHNTQNTPTNDTPESSNTRNQPPPQPRIPRSFLYSESVINEGINACNHSIIGKILTDKPIHINSIQNGLDNI